MKKGLVMEGGAMRGMFTAGVTDVFMENGIEFDGVDAPAVIPTSRVDLATSKCKSSSVCIK